MSPILSRNHELTGFATGTTTGSALGANWAGALLLGALGAVAADIPDIDVEGARIVKMLTLFCYPVPVLDKDGNHKRGKPKPRKLTATARATGKTKTTARTRAKRKAQARLRWLKAWDFLREVVRGPIKGKPLFRWRSWPGYQLHRWSVWASETVYDCYATPADRRDTLGGMGCRFRSHRGLTHSLWAAIVVGVAAWLGCVLLGPVFGWVIGVLLGALAGRVLTWVHRWQGWPMVGAIVGALLGGIVGPTMSTMSSSVFGPVPLSVLVGATVFVGMVTHVAGDSVTDAGVSFLAPLVLWRGRRYPIQALLFRPLRFKTGQQVEKDLISWVCRGLALVAIAYTFGVLGTFRDFLTTSWQAL